MCGHRVANATGFDVVRCVCSVVTNIGAKAQDIDIIGQCHIATYSAEW